MSLAEVQRASGKDLELLCREPPMQTGGGRDCFTTSLQLCCLSPPLSPDLENKISLLSSPRLRTAAYRARQELGWAADGCH